MSNPGGQNQFQRESPYGAVKKLTQLTKAAPVSGAPTPALNAPRQAQRRAARGQRVQPPQAVPQPPQQVSYHAQLAQVWSLIANETDDPLVREYAQRAAQTT